jgi:hypothetical protein
VGAVALAGALGSGAAAGSAGFLAASAGRRAVEAGVAAAGPRCWEAFFGWVTVFLACAAALARAAGLTAAGLRAAGRFTAFFPFADLGAGRLADIDRSS